MRVDHPEENAVSTSVCNAPPASAVNSRVMLTTIELLDRVAEIECATTLKDQRRRVPTEFDGVGAGLAYWAATYGPFASWRILCVTWKAFWTPVWTPRARRPQVNWLMGLWVRYIEHRRCRPVQPSKPTRRNSARIAS